MTRLERNRIRIDIEEIFEFWLELVATTEAHRPDSLPTAHLGLSDVQRARKLCYGRLTARARGELAARLVRANLLCQAINGGAQ